MTQDELKTAIARGVAKRRKREMREDHLRGERRARVVNAEAAYSELIDGSARRQVSGELTSAEADLFSARVGLRMAAMSLGDEAHITDAINALRDMLPVFGGDEVDRAALWRVVRAVADQAIKEAGE